MPTLRQLTAQLDNTKSIKLITQALGDIATLQIKSTRKSVQQNIAYFQDISSVYRTVKLIAYKNKLNVDPTAGKNGQTILVLLTSNYHFYGGLDANLVSFFRQSQAQYPSADKLLIGAAGIGLLQTGPKLEGKVSRLVLKKDSPNFEELKQLSTLVKPYSKVLVFHSKFVTLLNQKPAISDISETEEVDPKSIEQTHYILEPEIGKMLNFFQGQILELLLQAIFLDANIARTAARMVSMNQAEDNAEKLIKQNQRQMLQQRKSVMNRRILENFAGMQRRG